MAAAPRRNGFPICDAHAEEKNKTVRRPDQGTRTLIIHHQTKHGDINDPTP